MIENCVGLYWIRSRHHKSSGMYCTHVWLTDACAWSVCHRDGPDKTWRMPNDDKSAFFIPNGIEWLLKREGYVCGLFLVWEVSRRDCKFTSESRKGREGKGWNKPPISFPVVQKAWKSPFAQSSSLLVLFIFFFLLPFVKWRRATAPSGVKVIDLWSWRRRDERAYYNTQADARAHAIPSTQHNTHLMVGLLHKKWLPFCLCLLVCKRRSEEVTALPPAPTRKGFRKSCWHHAMQLLSMPSVHSSSFAIGTFFFQCESMSSEKKGEIIAFFSKTKPTERDNVRCVTRQ